MNSQKILWSFVFSCLAVLLSAGLVFSDETDNQDYLLKESFDLPTTGQAVHSTKPLDPAEIYTIKISSRYNLLPLKHFRLKKLRPEREIFNFKQIKKFNDEGNNLTSKLQTLFSKRQELLTFVEPENHNADEEKKQKLESLERELDNLKESQKEFKREKHEFELKKQNFERFRKQNPNWQLDTDPAPGPDDFPELFDRQTGSAILFDEIPLLVESTHPHTDQQIQSDYLDALTFLLRGHGRPLTLRLAANFSYSIGFLKVEVSSPTAAKAVLLKWIGIISITGIGAVFLTLVYLIWNKKRKLAKYLKEKKRLQLLEKPRLAEVEKEIKKLKEELERKEKQEKEREEEQQKITEPKEKIIELSLTPNLETFTPEPLAKEEWFKIVISGTYHYQYWGFCEADACYDSRHEKNHSSYQGLIYPYPGIFFNLATTPAQPFLEDRQLHQYTFAYCGTGNKLSILLKSPRGIAKNYPHLLSVKIIPFPEETERIKQEWEKREQEKQERERISEEEQHAKELACQQKLEELKLKQEQLDQEAQKKHEQELSVAVKGWLYRVELEPNFFDLEYRKNLAKSKRQEVLTKFKEKWFPEYRLVLSNEELLTRLQQEAPRVIEWLKFRNEVVFEAERLEVTKPPRMTTEEFRDKEIRKIATKAKDDRAKRLEVGKNKEVLLELKYQKFKEIDQREDLDDEQKDELKQVYQNITELDLENKDNGQEPQVI